MTQFLIQHGPYDEVTQILVQNMHRLRSILNHLQDFLRQKDEAIQGNQALLWEEQQHRWNQNYNDMEVALTGRANAAVNVGSVMAEGNRRSAQIMGG